jgi:D-psicose/D-tagatose/L-ribulose 3-epimerase
MKLAIQEGALDGANVHKRLKAAKALGLGGVELNAENVGDDISAILEAMQETGIQISAINVGGTHLLHPEFSQREAAIQQLHSAMAAAIDLGAGGVIFSPRRDDTPKLPDLHPYKSNIELEAELLVTELRSTLLDHAHAMDAMLFLAPQDSRTTHLLQRLDHARVIIDQNDDHPNIKIAANLRHIIHEEDEIADAIRHNARHIGYFRVADRQNNLPDASDADLQSAINALKQSGYDGWITLACHESDPQRISACAQAIRALIDA